MLDRVDAAISTVGLHTRGALNVSLDDATKSQGVILIGNIGGDFWKYFQASHTTGQDALDSWTNTVLDPIATQIGAKALYPSDQPYRPFQQWAMAAEGLQPSPLGILIHPTYGLWHAYRAAFVFDEPFENCEVPPRDHPCDVCSDKPCLSTCPVTAFTPAGYNVGACRSHVKSPAGEGCRKAGCSARQACPIGKRYQYSKNQQAFHMAAFVGSFA